MGSNLSLRGGGGWGSSPKKMQKYEVLQERFQAYSRPTWGYRPLYSYRTVITWVCIGFVNGGFEILWCEYLWVATSPCGGFGGPPKKIEKYEVLQERFQAYSMPTQGYRPLYSYRAVITWVYIGFVNRGFEILWCEYLWVASSPCGGFGGPPPRTF